MRVAQSKRGQSEIFGLMIVVLLVSLLLIMVLTFVVSNRGSEVQKTYTDKQLAINTVKAMISTNIPACRNVEFSEVIKDCFKYRELSCQGYADSCAFVAQESPLFLERTIGQWGVDYRYYVFLKGDEGPYESHDIRHSNTPDGCARAIAIEPGEFYLPTGAGQIVFIRLDVCMYDR